MKKDKDRQVGVRVGLPVFFALELEDVYRHTEGGCPKRKGSPLPSRTFAACSSAWGWKHTANRTHSRAVA